MDALEVIRGDDVTIHVAVTEDDAPADVSAEAWTCQVRTMDGALVGEMAVTFTDAATGKARLDAVSAEVRRWPVGRLRSDVEMVAAGRTQSTRAFLIEVLEDVTR